MMSERLLAIASVVLLFSSFSYTATENRFAAETGLSTTLLFARVLPMAFVTLVCILCIPVRKFVSLFRALGTPPFMFWSWFAAVAAIAGFISGYAPAWSLWKCLELFVIVLWAASVSVYTQMTERATLLRQIFTMLVVASYVVVVWSLTEVFREGESLQDYVLRGHRLDTTWPHINSITLCIMSLFAISGVLMLTTRLSFPVRAMMLIPLFVVFALARSRTGLLGLVVMAGFTTLTGTISRGRKVAYIIVPLGLMILLLTSPSLREYMRVDSWEELARGAGRLQTEDGRRSGWLDTLDVIQESPAIGHGYIIVRRFMADDHAAVDNFVLQSLVSAGLIGATPMILYSVFVFFRWLFGLRFEDPEAKLVAEMGVVTTCLGFVKSLTTNGISAYDYSLILFLFGCIAMQYVLFKYRISQRDQASSSATPASIPSEPVLADPS